MIIKAYLTITLYLVQANGTYITDRVIEIEQVNMIECNRTLKEKLNSFKINLSTPLAVRTKVRITCSEWN